MTEGENQQQPDRGRQEGRSGEQHESEQQRRPRPPLGNARTAVQRSNAHRNNGSSTGNSMNDEACLTKVGIDRVNQSGVDAGRALPASLEPSRYIAGAPVAAISACTNSRARSPPTIVMHAARNAG